MRFAALISVLLMVSCTTRPYTTIINGQDDGYDGHHYSHTVILAIDHQRIVTPTFHVGTYAGRHHLLVKTGVLRRAYGEPQEATISLDATFAANREYFISGGVFRDSRIGIKLFDAESGQDIKTVDSEHVFH